LADVFAGDDTSEVVSAYVNRSASCFYISTLNKLMSIG
jgi:uncharacterized protein related to proFAR isomerase